MFTRRIKDFFNNINSGDESAQLDVAFKKAAKKTKPLKLDKALKKLKTTPAKKLKKLDIGLDKVGKVAEEIQKPTKFEKSPKKDLQKAVSTNKFAKKANMPVKKLGLKRKGRLPSKQIINKLGNNQTVYYRPDKKTKSMYINPDKLNTAELVLDYGESFKRMLFRDHAERQGWVRNKGQQNVAWGSQITSKLDELADKYGFSLDKFDQQQESFLKDRHKSIDPFLQEAENIYGDLYKQTDRHPLEFLSRVFEPTQKKVHSKFVPERIKHIVESQMSVMKKAKEAKVAYMKGQDHILNMVKRGNDPHVANANNTDSKRDVNKKMRTGSRQPERNLKDGINPQVKQDVIPDKPIEKPIEKPAANKVGKTNMATKNDDIPSQTQLVKDKKVNERVRGFRRAVKGK